MTQYDIDEVAKIDKLRDALSEAFNADTYDETVTRISHIFANGHEGSDGYVKFGNNKVASHVAIFNMNSATDCDNRNTEKCQVPDGACYAYNDEQRYGAPLDYRRRQEYLWDCIDPETWAKAFLKMVDRKRNDVTAIRFSESGDFRHNGDIVRVNTIARIVGEEGINVYTYSASSDLNWSLAEDFTINASNELQEYGDRRFMALPAESELPDGTVWCPFDYYEGDDLDKRPKCGDCNLCINKEGPDVAIQLH